MGQAEDAEGERLALLSSCEIMGTKRENEFDRIVFTAAQLTRAPIALVTLVNDEISWAKARVGPVAKQRPRGKSFSHFVVEGNAPIVVEDASLDSRFGVSSVLSNGQLVRFLISVPLRGPRQLPLGALTVCGTITRPRLLRWVPAVERIAREAEELLVRRIPTLDLAP